MGVKNPSISDNFLIIVKHLNYNKIRLNLNSNRKYKYGSSVLPLQFQSHTHFFFGDGLILQSKCDINYSSLLTSNWSLSGDAPGVDQSCM